MTFKTLALKSSALGKLLPLAAVSLAIGLAQPASAAVLYDNGPINGTLSAWTINFGFAVSDSFTLASTSTITGVNFGVWSFPGDTMSTVDWAITSTPNAYPIDGTAAVTNGATSVNGFGYDLSWDSFSTGAVTLGPGTYYLVLQNAGVPTGDPIYWDINNGPSTAYENTIGDVNGSLFPGTNSDAFQILGTTGGVPEPATWAMSILGFGMLGSVLRRRKVAAVAA